MTDVMEAAEAAKEGPAAETEPTYWIYTAEGPDAIYKGIPDDDIPAGNQREDYTVIEHPNGGWYSKSGRPAYRVANAKLTRFVPPTEWGEDMFTWRMRQLQQTGSWNEARRDQVRVALRKFLVALAEDKVDAAQAGDIAVGFVQEAWPAWTGRKTQEAVNKLGQEIFNSTWRIDPKVVSIADRVMAIPGTRGQDTMTAPMRRTLITVLEQMVTENLTFASDGARYAAVRERCKKLANGTWHTGYSDTNGSMGLRDLLRELWPDTVGALPEHIQVMTEEQAKTTLALFEEREKAAHAELWRKAEERNWCPEFDAILIRAGYPPRPKSYQVYFEVALVEDMTARKLQRDLGYEVEIEGPIKRKYNLNLAHKTQAGDKPTKAAAKELLTDEVVRQALSDYLGDADRVKAIHIQGVTVSRIDG